MRESIASFRFPIFHSSGRLNNPMRGTVHASDFNEGGGTMTEVGTE